jgi:hypothetical protein
MPLSNPELWSRVADYPMPRPVYFRGQHTPAPDFESQIAQELSVSPLDAARLVREYRKFLYLKAIDGGLLSPPPDLDEVWHRHIDSAQGGWESFCRDAIGKPLIHRRRLSSAESRAAYARAVTLYEREFGWRPPDIWPSPGDAARYRLGVAIGRTGWVIFFVGFFSTLAVSMAGGEPNGWVLITLCGGMALVVVGATLADGAQVARTSDCG